MSPRRYIWKSIGVGTALCLLLTVLVGITAHWPAAQWQEVVRRALLPGYLAANALIASLAGRSLNEGLTIGLILFLASLFDIAIFSLTIFLFMTAASVLKRHRV